MALTNEVKQWLEDRKREGLEIDPDTAEVTWLYGQTLDPYGVYDFTDEEKCIGREYFARRPGGTWVSFGDLPDATREKLWQQHKRELAFNPIETYENSLLGRIEQLYRELDGLKSKRLLASKASAFDTSLNSLIRWRVTTRYHTENGAQYSHGDLAEIGDLGDLVKRADDQGLIEKIEIVRASPATTGT